MLTDKEKKKLEKKIKGISGTNNKISALLFEKLSNDLKVKDSIKEDIKNKIKKCDGEVLYLYNMASDMWYMVGDKSTDYNFYTKRIILCGILSKLYLKILTDNNYSEEKLNKDIENEIINVGKFNKIKSKILSYGLNPFEKRGSKNSSRGY